MSKFNVLTFYKRFDKSAEFIALKNFVFNGEEVKAGDTFDKSKYPWHKIKMLWQVRKIGMLKDKPEVVTEEIVTEEVVTEEVVTTKPKQARVEKAGVWYKVYDENGNQIGKSTRDETEAELIKIEYDN